MQKLELKIVKNFGGFAVYDDLTKNRIDFFENTHMGRGQLMDFVYEYLCQEDLEEDANAESDDQHTRNSEGC